MSSSARASRWRGAAGSTKWLPTCAPRTPSFTRNFRGEGAGAGGAGGGGGRGAEEPRGDAAAALEWSRDSVTLARASRSYGVCGDGREVAALTRELAKRFAEATLVMNVVIPVAEAALALHEGQPARAIDLLEAARPYERAPSSVFWPPYLRGQAHLMLKDDAAALVEFRRIVDHVGEVPLATLYPLAQLGAARAALRMKDTEAARKRYTDFLVAWKDADPDLRVFREARLERER